MKYLKHKNALIEREREGGEGEGERERESFFKNCSLQDTIYFLIMFEKQKFNKKAYCLEEIFFIHSNDVILFKKEILVYFFSVHHHSIICF